MALLSSKSVLFPSTGSLSFYIYLLSCVHTICVTFSLIYIPLYLTFAVRFGPHSYFRTRRIFGPIYRNMGTKMITFKGSDIILHIYQHGLINFAFTTKLVRKPKANIIWSTQKVKTVNYTIQKKNNRSRIFLRIFTIDCKSKQQCILENYIETKFSSERFEQQILHRIKL